MQSRGPDTNFVTSCGAGSRPKRILIPPGELSHKTRIRARGIRSRNPNSLLRLLTHFCGCPSFSTSCRTRSVRLDASSGGSGPVHRTVSYTADGASWLRKSVRSHSSSPEANVRSSRLATNEVVVQKEYGKHSMLAAYKACPQPKKLPAVRAGENALVLISIKWSRKESRIQDWFHTKVSSAEGRGYVRQWHLAQCFNRPQLQKERSP